MLHLSVLPVLASLVLAMNAAEDDYASLKRRAEEQVAAGSHTLARELYQQAEAKAPDAAERRWVAFRLADTLWRARAASENPDPSDFERAQRELDALVRDVERAEDRDRTFAEVHESLGDFFWVRQNQWNFGEAWAHYQPALDFWAGTADVDLARARYLAIARKIVAPGSAGEGFDQWRARQAPAELLDAAVAIAFSPEEKGWARFVRAFVERERGAAATRVAADFEAAIELGRAQPWYDDALYFYGEWLGSGNRRVRGEDGQLRSAPDFVAALRQFERLVAEFESGRSQWRDDAAERAKQIRRLDLSLQLGTAFRPGEAVKFEVSWRNAARVDFALYAVDLRRDLALSGEDILGLPADRIDLGGRERLRAWGFDTDEPKDHAPRSRSVDVEAPLEIGAYVLSATSGEASARALLLVTDLAVVVKSDRGQTLVWVTDAETGAPVAEADVRLWRRFQRNDRGEWRKLDGRADSNGVAAFEGAATGEYLHEVVIASSGKRTALSGSSHWLYGGREPDWRIQAITDRPAYRPEDVVHFKVQARWFDGSTYATPDGAKLRYAIVDPRGSKVKEGDFTLNDFGSALGEFALSAALPLGEYRIDLVEPKADRGIGSATLFRLEEYKLPEFEVTVRAPEEGGRRKVFTLGDRAEVEIAASYYFGGPVADASVVVVVRQRPKYVAWQEPREFPWYFESGDGDWRRWNQGQEILRQETRTDAEGVAVVRFDTPADSQQDLEYLVEARVTDASRREISATGSVAASRFGYYVHARARHNVFQPGDPVDVDFHTFDANSEPVAAIGTAKVLRERLVERFIALDGRPLALAELPVDRAGRIVPPPGVRREIRYVRDEVLARPLETTAAGSATLSFAAGEPGCYVATWYGLDRNGVAVLGETALFVAREDTIDLAWRRGDLEILVDRDTVRPGEEALAMLSSASGAGHVLFSVESERVHSWQVLHMTGSAKLVRVKLDARHVPNTFLCATTVRGGRVDEAVADVVVPPVEQFLTVAVTPEESEVEPGSKGSLAVTVKDHQGKPVAAELSLALVDESVFAIQADYAADPRQHYYGSKRDRAVRQQSSIAFLPFARGEYRGPGDSVERDAGEFGVEYAKESRMDAKLEQLGYLGTKAKNLRGQPTGGASQELSDAAPAPASAEPMRGGLPATAGWGGAPGAEPAVTVRTDFRATAFWQGDVVTDADGTARVSFDYPQTLTRWKATARGATQGSAFGLGSATARTSLPLTARLQAPRFFTAGDLAAISVLIDNNTDLPARVTPRLERDGAEAFDLGERGDLAPSGKAALEIAPRGQARVDWFLRFDRPGATKLRVGAASAEHADAMEQTFEVYERGIDQLIAKSGAIRGTGAEVALDLPEARKPGTTRFAIQLQPSLATTMLDALPYLIDYPYGCTEQTMSRFLPAAIVAKALQDAGLDAGTAMARAFGGIEAASAGATHPKGKKDLAELGAITKAGLQRLYDFQHGDGGFGWWQQGESDPFMTAYVLWGLALARGADIAVDADAARRAAEFLDSRLVEAEHEPEQAAWLLHALAAHQAASRAKATEFQVAAFDRLWKQRQALNAYGRALFALAAHGMGRSAEARTLVDNLVDGVRIDRTPDTSIVVQGGSASAETVLPTAHYGSDGLWRRWTDGPVESTATALRALLAIRPDHELVVPLMNWLVKNRRGAQWSSTRDTAMAVLALGEYWKRSGEAAADLEFTLAVNGTELAARRLTAADALGAPLRFEVPAELVRGGRNTVRIGRSAGPTPLYFSMEARFFTTEDPIREAGNEVFVRREYWQLAPRRTLLKGVVYDRLPVRSGDVLASGTRVETVITVEAKNDLEYMMFEDLKPAGLEAVEVKSGQWLSARELKASALDRRLVDGAAPGSAADGTGRTRYVHQELRDRKVALFLDRLPQGVWEIRYEMRAEVPGTFRALPVIGQAMYVPEIRGNGAEHVLGVK